MEQVLKALPADLHPIAAEGFLSTAQPDLLIDRPLTPLQWLLGGQASLLASLPLWLPQTDPCQHRGLTDIRHVISSVLC